MIERTLYTPEHIAFRDSYQRFADKEIAPHHAAWEEQGYVDRAVWEKAGANGFLCMTMPEDCGGAGADRLYAVAQMEVNAAGGYSGIGFGLHNEIVAPYVERYGTAAQKQKYLPAMARGEIIGAIAMSEPAAGSDLQGIKTAAVRQDDGSYLLNGSKTFITNGWHADLVIVVAKTDPTAGAHGISLLLVERGMPGFEKGQRLKKLGLKAQDTSELFFDNVALSVPTPAVGAVPEDLSGCAADLESAPGTVLEVVVRADGEAGPATISVGRFGAEALTFELDRSLSELVLPEDARVGTDVAEPYVLSTSGSAVICP